jgi:hypothetical protein
VLLFKEPLRTVRDFIRTDTAVFLLWGTAIVTHAEESEPVQLENEMQNDMQMQQAQEKAVYDRDVEKRLKKELLAAEKEMKKRVPDSKIKDTDTLSEAKEPSGKKAGYRKNRERISDKEKEGGERESESVHGEMETDKENR